MHKDSAVPLLCVVFLRSEGGMPARRTFNLTPAAAHLTAVYPIIAAFLDEESDLVEAARWTAASLKAVRRRCVFVFSWGCTRTPKVEENHSAAGLGKRLATGPYRTPTD